MAGDGGSNIIPREDTLNLLDSASPLQIFVRAKKKINNIFVEVEEFVRKTTSYMNSLQEEKDIIDPDESNQVESYMKKVKGIKDVLARNNMKVVFFGRTSNGKSTVINAMLREKILPSGIGHTTNCFLQVEGSENGESYLMTEGSEERQNVKNVGQLGHALCKERLNESTLVKIFWPKDKCLLLRDDVVFVDSPGIDVSPNLDEWIDKHCLDADVFVLVANAESTLMLTEKNFFHKVSTRLSKPNIFILNNRWDASASEPEFLDEVRGQHMDRTMDFLVKELKVCTTKQAKERIFFVSAKEALQGRFMEQKGQPAHAGALAEGFSTRYSEFKDFERKFEECISKSAVKTKFEQHTQRGKLITSDISKIMDEVNERTQRLKEQKSLTKKELFEKQVYVDQQLRAITQEMKGKINQMVDDVEQKVSKALSEEIRRLSTLVDEFNLPFHPEQLVLNVYKKELHSHVENGLGSNLRTKLSSALAMNIENSKREMTDRMSSLLPPEKKQATVKIMPRREPFEILYRLNCDNLCGDFQEKLEFRFSWGFTSIIERFSGKHGKHIMLKNCPNRIPRDLLSPVENQDISQLTFPSPLGEEDSLLSSITSKMLMGSVASQGTVGGLLVSGFLLKTVGWRLILVTVTLYGCIYLYERLSWTNKAKEREFKRQYVNHATKKLHLIVDLTSANCSHQVHQELSSTFAQLCRLVDESSADINNKIKQLEQELRLIQEAASAAKTLRTKANYLGQELTTFDETFLQMEN